MDRYLCVALVALVSAATAFAAPNTTKPNGPLNLYIDADGVGTMVNDGTVPFSFDGYTILSAGGLLGDVTGIFDNTILDMAGFPPSIGLTMADALAWTEMSTTPTNYSEVTMGVPATLPAGGSINLGAAFLDMDCVDMTFTYVDSATGGSYEGSGWGMCPPPPDAWLDLGGPYVWDVVVDSMLTIPVSGTATFNMSWSIDEYPSVNVNNGQLSWPALQAAGAGLETITVSADGFDEYSDHAADSAAVTLVPEPATLSLLGLGAMAMIRRRR